MLKDGVRSYTEEQASFLLFFDSTGKSAKKAGCWPSKETKMMLVYDFSSSAIIFSPLARADSKSPTM
jgi:hypothetical protein